MSTDWDTQTVALGMRDVIAAIAENRINALRPLSSYAVVQTINRELRSATVRHVGDETDVTVAMGSIEPATVGQTVRIGGSIGHRYIEDVLGNAVISGNDARYAETGHTHAGGGAISIGLDDLSDVDTTTNPPDVDSVLGWNDVGGFWEPVSVDLGTAFLPLTGGTVTGAVIFNAGVSMLSTLSVGAGLTAQSFSGIGTNLTNLNATQLTTGTIPVARFPSTIGSNTTGTAAAWTTARQLSVTGDMVGNVLIKGDADMSMAVTIQAGGVTLGDDTTGNYVEHIIGTGNQVITNTVVATEKAIHTLSLPQNIHTAATPTFSRLSLGVVTGTAPMTITSVTMVPNLTAHYLGAVNQDDTFFRNASNLNAGTVPSARLAGAYSGVTGLGTLTTLTVAGATTLATPVTVAGNTVWHAGNDGAGSGLDAGLLGGVPASGYASVEVMESLMGDLLAVGLYDAASYNGERFSIIFNRPTHTMITGLTIASGDHPFDVRFDVDMPSIPQSDMVTGESRRRIIRNNVYMDFTRTGDDDYLDRSVGNASTVNDLDLYSPTVFTIRMRLRKSTLLAAGVRIIARHGSTASDSRWQVHMDAGKLVLAVSANGTAVTTIDVLTAAELDAIAGTANNTDFYVAMTVRLTGSNLEARGWGSVDGVTWTTAALNKIVAFAFPQLFATTSPLTIGGPTGATQWDGRIYWIDMVPESDPNGVSSILWRFDARDRPYGGGTAYTDPLGRPWTLFSAATVIHATVAMDFYVQTNVALRSVTSPPFSYWQSVGRPWHVRGTWNPATDQIGAAWRDGAGGLALEAATPAWTQTLATFGGETMSTVGAVVIGEQSGPQWSFGGRMRRALISKNSVTILDLRSSNITVAGQTVITPTLGPPMTFSSTTMAITTMPKPVWAEGPTVYRHNMYWIVASLGEVDFIDSDLSGRYDVDIDDAVTVSNGDWIVAIDPLFGSPGHEEGSDRTLSEMVFQYVPFSTETFIKAQIQEHANDSLDPHSAAGYLKTVIANSLYSPLVHTHAAEISDHILIHTQESDPHPIYLTQGEGDGRYVQPGQDLPYEPQGAVLAHEQKVDPHPQYTTHAEANQAYADINHNHVEFALQGHTHPTSSEVMATDGAQSARIFIGEDAPVNPLVGDLWIRTFDISLQPPGAPTGLTYSATPNSITVSWQPWDVSVGIDRVEAEWSADGLTGWANILIDTVAPFDTSFTHTGRAERTSYFYRVRGRNLAGTGLWSTFGPSTTNAPPGAVGGLSTSLITTTSMRLNWAASPSPANDPLHPTSRYEVFRSGIYQGSTMSLFWDYGGLTENTGYSLGVRVKDDQNLVSTLTTISATTANANPPPPSGLYQVGVNHYQFHMGWSAVSGVADFNRYQVFVNGGFWADVYATDYLFSGLAPSTGYTFGVRSVDNLGAVSAISTLGGVTSVNPDTTPPAPVTFHSWRPRNNYGEMWFEYSVPGDVAYGELYYNVNGSGWVTVYQGGFSGYHLSYLGSFGSGNTIYAAINYRDAAGNWTYSPHYAYTLTESPALFAPHSSNSWRGTNGGEWNAPGGYRPVQGWYSNPALNSIGFWFYGYDFQNWWQAGRTLVDSHIFINRQGCGINQQDWMRLWVHQMPDSPGDTSFWGTPYIAGGYDIGTVQYEDSKWMGFPLGWAYDLCGGTWRGLAVHQEGGKPYVCLYPAGAGYSGVVALYHLG